jgi:cell division protein FtsI (penicillin-binding protein 3)
MNRYFWVVMLLVLVGIGIVLKAANIMFRERAFWQVVAERFVNDSVPLPPTRGNILSCDGKLMASSLPEYRIYMDFKAGGKGKDTLLLNHLDEICRGLHTIFPDRSAAAFKAHLLKGRKMGSRNYLLYPKRISYIQYKEAKRLPVFNLNKYRGGFHEQTFNYRKKPFGSLAARTLGDLYADTTQGAKNGIELAFDGVLKGQYGMAHRQKVMNQYLSLATVPPVNGCDVVTTLDVDMQDICEKALVDKLKEIEAEVGVVVLMEVKTGDVKAIVNMDKAGDGNYYEMRNHAISDLMEPGSTFKTASLMVALEDGKITPHTPVDAEKGAWKVANRTMTDHNRNRGGYGKIDATRALEVSSNIGVSKLIVHAYGHNQQQFIDGLRRMSLHQPLHLQIPGEGTPNIRDLKGDVPVTALPWMSIGYGTQLPPINILTFYNAIANDGRMMRPRLVKEVLRGGEVIETFPPEVINPQICSEKTLKEIRAMLLGVVTNGLGKAAKTADFEVAGKTGTAQIWGKSGNTGGHLVSFCGYFPADAPKYSCIVSIQRPKTRPISGGLMAGSVFGKIAARLYAKELQAPLEAAVDSTTNLIPPVKAGDLRQTLFVLQSLKVPVQKGFDTPGSSQVWGTAQPAAAAVALHERRAKEQTVPNVLGMGAKDALFLLESCGLEVRLQGVGRVKRQSIPAGNALVKGQTVRLELENE